ncbi:DUF3307 domain-containing protein [Kiritimatiellaeota bacterium B1221]|nr:DUF3307 domain-containing protein [Kiritimatiellaeota bacterium B1221]
MREFAVLICAHILGDFLFQTNWIAQNKGRIKGWWVHVLIHGALVYLVAMQWGLWKLPLAVALLHGLVDLCKCRFPDTPKTFFIDQMVHVGILGLFSGGLSEAGITLTPDPWYEGLVWISGFVLVTKGAGFAVAKVAQALVEENGLVVKGLKHGGACIGNLERSLIFLLILIGQPGAIGFLVAAKSILRFEEAKKQELAEYVLIGTLLSFTLAIASTFLTMMAVSL